MKTTIERQISDSTKSLKQILNDKRGYYLCLYGLRQRGTRRLTGNDLKSTLSEESWKRRFPFQEDEITEICRFVDSAPASRYELLVRGEHYINKERNHIH